MGKEYIRKGIYWDYTRIIHGSLKPLTSCTGFLPQVNYPYRVLTRRDEHRPERERRELMAACWFSRGTIGIIGYILGLHRDNGKEHGNYLHDNRVYFEVV